jgi:cysteinyl-tRNA synthetase
VLANFNCTAHRHTFGKIIQRARQNHLLDTFRSETKTMTSDLINQVHAAWRTHVREKVAKGLPNSERPIEGDEETAWPRLCELVQDIGWKQECIRRDEKFEMYFSSAVRLLYKVSSSPL